jgi:hypothetical protein
VNQRAKESDGKTLCEALQQKQAKGREGQGSEVKSGGGSDVGLDVEDVAPVALATRTAHLLFLRE